MREFGPCVLGRAIYDSTFSEMTRPFAHALAVVHAAHGAEIVLKARVAEALISLSDDSSSEVRDWATFGLGVILDDEDGGVVPELALGHRFDESPQRRGRPTVAAAEGPAVALHHGDDLGGGDEHRYDFHVVRDTGDLHADCAESWREARRRGFRPKGE